MTTHPIEHESLHQAVARRIRGIMGERDISGSAVARQLGMTQQAFSQRKLGRVEFKLTEIETLARVLRTTPEYLLTGVRNDESPRRRVPGGGSFFVLPEQNALRACRDSNPKPSDP